MGKTREGFFKHDGVTAAGTGHSDYLAVEGPWLMGRKHFRAWDVRGKGRYLVSF